MAHCKPDGAAEQSSKIEPRADRDRTRKDTSCIACDSAETGRVDVRVRIAPNRTVQQIDRIRSNRKCLGFGDLDPFAQGGIEPHDRRNRGTLRNLHHFCQNSVSVGCGLQRAGATGGGRDGRARESRTLRATTGSSNQARCSLPFISFVG